MALEKKGIEVATRTKTYIEDLPYCPIRVGRVFNIDGEEKCKPIAVITCGYQETTLGECLNCHVPHKFKENQGLTAKKLVRNTIDIRELKQRLKSSEEQTEKLRKQFNTLIQIFGERIGTIQEKLEKA